MKLLNKKTVTDVIAVIRDKDSKEYEILRSHKMNFFEAMQDAKGKSLALHEAKDGRHFLEFTSKKDGKRYFMQIPKDLAERL